MRNVFKFKEVIKLLFLLVFFLSKYYVIKVLEDIVKKIGVGI